MTSQPKTVWTKKQVIEATDGQYTSDSINDWSAEGISIDSRTCDPRDLFVALSGPNFDGHDYIDKALAKGAVAAIVSKVPENIKKSEKLILVITPSIVELKTISDISLSSSFDKSGSIFKKNGILIEFFLLKEEILFTNLSRLLFFSKSLKPGVLGEDTFIVI